MEIKMESIAYTGYFFIKFGIVLTLALLLLWIHFKKIEEETKK